jgi:putative autoinducer-2 (AI-2) aldolase
VVRHLLRARSHGLHAGKLLLLASTWATWFFGIVVAKSDLAFTVTNVVAHGVPYLALTYRYARGREAEGGYGALRSVVPASATKAVVLRCSGGQSILTELSRETIAVDIEDAIRLNAAAITTQIYIGAEYEHQSIKNLIQLIDTGNRVGIPTMAVTGVGADMKRDALYFGLATRIAAELGAHYVKSYFVEEGFERICAGCPVPIVIAGGKKLPELDALTMAWKAIDQGAAGVDMGRNIFQSDDPVAMIQAVGAVVHKNEKPKQAFQLYQQLKGRNVPDRSRVARSS